MKRGPPGDYLIDFDSALALTGGNLPNVESKKGNLGGIRQFADLDVDRLLCPLAIEYQGDLGPHVQTRGHDPQFRGIRNMVIGQLHDHVTTLQPAGRGRAAGLNPRDQNPVIVGKLQPARVSASSGSMPTPR